MVWIKKLFLSGHLMMTTMGTLCQTTLDIDQKIKLCMIVHLGPHINILPGSYELHFYFLQPSNRPAYF